MIKLKLVSSVLVICTILVSTLHAQPPHPDKEKVFVELDLNKNGFLDKEEFKTGAEKRRAEKKNSRDPKKAFEKLDVDKNGSISYEEFEKMHKMIAKREKEYPDSIFNEIDANKDGKISKYEFMQHKGPERRIPE